MTEAEWLACTDPQKMLAFLRDKASARTLRLFAVACCRSIWPVLIDERSRRAIELSEKAADQPVSEAELDHASGEAEEAFEDLLSDEDDADPEANAHASAASAASYASNPDLHLNNITEVLEAAAEASRAGAAQESKKQADLLRDLFGNPFRTVSLDSVRLSWNGGSIPELAQGIYDEQAFDRLPILADALEEAGCTEPEILSHCRGPGPHVRGCWALDPILGKR
jgi:hypothetical protein